MKKNNHSLQTTILLITLVFTIVIGGILSVITAIFYNRYIKNTIVENTAANLSFMTDSVNRNIEELSDMIFFCQTHLYIGDFLKYNGSSSPAVAIKAYDRLSEEYRSSSIMSYIHRIIIGNDYDKYIQIVEPYFSTSRNVSLMTRELDVYKEQIQLGQYNFSQGFIPDPYVRRTGKNVLLIVSPISYTYSFVRGGYACFSLSESFFTAPMQYYALPEDSSLYLTLGEHVYRMKPDSLSEIQTEHVECIPLQNGEWSTTVTAYSFHDTVSDQNGIVVTQPLSVDGCYISQVISSGELASRKPLYLIIIVAVTLLIVLIGILLSVILYRVIDIPVVKIQKKLERVSSGDFSHDSSIEWRHELGDIGRGINTLSQNIEALMEERIQDEKDKKDLEYKMLQSQINPHFLYNTLNSIKWMAVTQGADGIAEMTTALSKLMRSISKGTKILIPLRDELELVSDYFTIQQYRYGGSLKMNISVDDDELYDCLIIKFTLQPIVENAIFHGIEPKQVPGMIDIHIFKNNDGHICIEIKDNGIGMSFDKIKEIFSEHTSDKTQLFREIGIANIQKRIQYEFGSEYGISIESEPGEYTKMTICIPDRR